MLRHAMAIGDLVVLTRKTVPQVAIGRVAGPYAYLADKTAPHTRKVEWTSPDVPRQVFDQKRRYRHLAALVALGVAPHQSRAYLRNRLGHQGAPA